MKLEKKIQHLKSSNLAVKAQIHAGGRGKAGGIKLVKNKKDFKSLKQQKCLEKYW